MIEPPLQGSDVRDPQTSRRHRDSLGPVSGNSQKTIQEGKQRETDDPFWDSEKPGAGPSGLNNHTSRPEVAKSPSRGESTCLDDEGNLAREDRCEVKEQGKQVAGGASGPLRAAGKETWADPPTAESSESESSESELSRNAPRQRSETEPTGRIEKEKILKMSPARIHELTNSPRSLPLRALDYPDDVTSRPKLPPSIHQNGSSEYEPGVDDGLKQTPSRSLEDIAEVQVATGPSPLLNGMIANKGGLTARRPQHTPRSASSPSVKTGRTSQLQPPSDKKISKHSPTPLRFVDGKGKTLSSSINEVLPSPMPKAIPLPPMSLPTFLELELSSHRPSPLYIHRSATSDFPYESSRVKVERLLNFLLLPPQLEQVLWFGTLACLDAWLYTFTILPLRLLKSFYILGQSWAKNMVSEAQYVVGYIYAGSRRMWKRRNTKDRSTLRPIIERQTSQGPKAVEKSDLSHANGSITVRNAYSRHNSTDRTSTRRRHRRTKSVPSALQPDDKADILKGLLIICTCILLMRLDASREYHWIRGQAAIKLYVIYNVLEVGDRLLSAIGQDVLECLFSREALERGPDGHSKVIRPFWLFLLALAYTVAHSTALFYQVITLNVAVNSYSNALITLLMSNQFVEIKSTVFKKFEKENLFQLTCADVVERFQLWLMLLIIACRNIGETGGLSPQLGSSAPSFASVTNASDPLTQPLLSTASILPRSFTLLPETLSSLTAYAPGIGHVLGPFFVVLGSEMIIDSLKHCYINKFNNTRPALYGRFLDVLAKDYYSNAFADQNLTKRLGLPVIPLSCLFIRASVQTFHIFQAAWIPPTTPSAATGLSSSHEYYSSATKPVPTSTTAALSQRFDALLRQIPSSLSTSSAAAHFSTTLICLVLFLLLLAFKLILGMALLAFARWRYRSMKEREKNPIHHVEGGRRVGGWGVVEVDEDKRRTIYEDDPEGWKGAREREEKGRAKREEERSRGVEGFERVKRYDMIGKRIW